MKKIIVIFAILCTMVSANCVTSANNTVQIGIICFDSSAEFEVIMRKDGSYLKWIERFNGNIIEMTHFYNPLESNEYYKSSCIRKEKDKYGVIIEEEHRYGCTTPGKRWKELKKVYNF